MKTKKNNMNNANEVCNVLENGKEVFAVAKETTSAKRCKLHTEQVSTTAASVETKDYTEKAYNVLQGIELEKAKSTVPVSVLVSAMAKGEDELTSVVNSVLEYNKAVNVRNARALWKAFASWYKNQRGTDFETWRKTLRNRWNTTKGFSLTFQDERTDETTDMYEHGAFYARNTSITAAGIRTSFNSVVYTKRTAAKMAERAQREKEVSEAKAVCIAHGMPAQVVDAMPAAAILATAKAFAATV